MRDECEDPCICVNVSDSSVCVCEEQLVLFWYHSCQEDKATDALGLDKIITNTHESLRQTDVARTGRDASARIIFHHRQPILSYAEEKNHAGFTVKQLPLRNCWKISSIIRNGKKHIEL